MLFYAVNNGARQHDHAHRWLTSALGGTDSGAAGNLATDAHIAALAVDHGATVASFDKDFERFNVPVLVPGRD